MFGLIGRLVFFELLKVFALSLGAVTAVLTIGGAMLEASRQGLDPLMVFAVLPLIIPTTLPFTIPTCLLFACTFVYSRMSNQLEVVALKAGGINASRIFIPAWSLAAGVCVLGLLMSDRFIPWCNRRFTQAILSDMQSAMFTYIQQNGEIVLPDFPYEIYVRDVQGDRLIRPVFKRRGPDGVHDMVAMAEEATLNVQVADSGKMDETQVILYLIDGVVCSTKQAGSFHFEKRAFNMPMPPIAHMRDDKLENSSNSQCLARSKRKREEIAKIYLELGSSVANSMLGGNPELSATEESPAVDQAARLLRKSRESVAEVHMRCAQSGVALPFVLLGCPIGILFQRRDFLHTFFACFLPVITLYYPALILAFNVYKEGVLPYGIVLWFPSIAMLLFSVPLFRRVVRF